MIVLVVERVSPSVRGEITRWLIEVHPGVFAGKVSAAVRELLWEYVCGKLKGGAAVLLYPAANEQGFSLRSWGGSKRRVVDFDGLLLTQMA